MKEELGDGMSECYNCGSKDIEIKLVCVKCIEEDSESLEQSNRGLCYEYERAEKAEKALADSQARVKELEYFKKNAVFVFNEIILKATSRKSCAEFAHEMLRMANESKAKAEGEK
jgi:hypothetical protein